MVFDVESRNGQLWGVARCQVNGTLSPEEKEILADYTSGQASDGMGVKASSSEKSGSMKVSYMSACGMLETGLSRQNEERFSPDSLDRLPELCWSVLPSTGALISVSRKEKAVTIRQQLGYRRSGTEPACSADYSNQKRRITPEQVEAMVDRQYAWLACPQRQTPPWYRQDQAQSRRDGN